MGLLESTALYCTVFYLGRTRDVSLHAASDRFIQTKWNLIVWVK